VGTAVEKHPVQLEDGWWVPTAPLGPQCFHLSTLPAASQGQQSHSWPRERQLATLTTVMEKEVSGTLIACCPRSPSCSVEELTRSLH